MAVKTSRHRCGTKLRVTVARYVMPEVPLCVKVTHGRRHRSVAEKTSKDFARYRSLSLWPYVYADRRRPNDRLSPVLAALGGRPSSNASCSPRDGQSHDICPQDRGTPAILGHTPQATYTGHIALCMSVCLCLCLSQVGVLSKRLNEWGWFFAQDLLSTRPTLCYKEIQVPSKIRAFPSGTVQTLFTLHRRLWIGPGLVTLCSFHCYFMYLHSYLTCIVFHSPLFYHVQRVVTRLRFVNRY